MRTTHKYRLDRLIWNKASHIRLFGNVATHPSSQVLEDLYKELKTIKKHKWNTSPNTTVRFSHPPLSTILIEHQGSTIQASPFKLTSTDPEIKKLLHTLIILLNQPDLIILNPPLLISFSKNLGTQRVILFMI
ncbi:hypothetical protein HYC85_027960 [Camellia sinensis]|uniref:Uncharacterized protein n=1 Tax=Camellia sinensis TaxID=4442 RepID=A0A7J7FU27_CAMSI|nr:hypothetical protein HYC85_027960 [Camellia sinensis]